MGGYYKIELLNVGTDVNSMSNVDQTISGLDKDIPDVSDMVAMCNNLKILKDWATNEKVEKDDNKCDFYEFFENAIIGSFCRYRKSKTSTWSIKKNWMKVLGIAVLPVLSALLMLLLDKANQPIIGNSVPAVAALLIIFCAVQMYLEWSKNKNDKETWVRHSVCYERLNLALNRFVLSDKKDNDFMRLKNETFAILEQNFDQFTLNLSSKGAAKRPKISSTED